MAMDFFRYQEKATTNTRLLVFLMVSAVVAIVAAVYMLVVAAFFYVGKEQGDFSWWMPKVALYVSCGVVALVTLGSLYKTIQLGSDGGVVARMMGGTLVDPDTREPGERRLLNVVEEMSIASGVPVPDVFVLQDEPGINAFAAGLHTSKAAVAVTKGCLEQLTRDELQGVIAHEFSHILRGDMRLNLRMIGILHGILLLGILGYWMLRSSYGFSSRRSRGKGNQLALIGLGLLVVGYVGVFFGKLIKAALSRQREFLADASAVQFTRNDWGLAGALKKIAQGTGSRLVTPNAEQASHMFFSNALSNAWFKAMATHPPIQERIKRLQPSYLPDAVAEAAYSEAAKGPEAGMVPGLAGGMDAQGVERRPQPQVAGAPGSPGGRVEVGGLVATVGRPTKEHLDYAKRLLASIPGVLLDAARNTYSARALVYCLLLDRRNPEVRKAQISLLAKGGDKAVFSEVSRLDPEVLRCRVEHKLPLVDLCLPALRGMSESQYRSFMQDVKGLIRADHRIDLFEFMLQNLLKRHLGSRFEDRRRQGRVSSGDYRESLSILLSVLSRAAGKEQEIQRQAFESGCKVFGHELKRIPPDRVSLSELSIALHTLSGAPPKARKKALEAAVAAVAADGFATTAEAELLRAVADGMDCPVPPVWPGQELENRAGS